jgi:hypothetical protein
LDSKIVKAMSGSLQQLSERRAIWWARSFSRPLQARFTADEDDTPDDLRALLEMADVRQSEPGEAEPRKPARKD